MKDNKKLIIPIILVTIFILIFGATYAYWTWSTVRNNETNIALTVSGSTDDLYAIINGNVSMSTADVNLLPTNNCLGPNALQKTVSITYKNGTSQLAMVEAQLDLTGLTVFSCDRNLTDSELSHMHWAITTNASSCSSDVVSSGTFEEITFNEVNFSFGGGGGGGCNKTLNETEDPQYGDIATLNEGNPMIMIPTYNKMQNEVTTSNYYVYVWIDENYSWTNYGDYVDDPLSDLTFILQWHGKIYQVLCGDVDLDGTITENDATIVQGSVMGHYSYPFYQQIPIDYLGDVDGDGEITTTDMLLIMRVAAGQTNASQLHCPESE